MRNLNLDQKKKRGKILQAMFNTYRENHPWESDIEAAVNFTDYFDSDPTGVQVLNALAASGVSEDITTEEMTHGV